jgi:hypothetical protein
VVVLQVQTGVFLTSADRVASAASSQVRCSDAAAASAARPRCAA